MYKYSQLNNLATHTHKPEEMTTNDDFNRVGYRPTWDLLENVADMENCEINRDTTVRFGQNKVKVNWAGYTKEEWAQVVKAENAGEDEDIEGPEIEDLYPMAKVLAMTDYERKEYATLVRMCLLHEDENSERMIRIVRTQPRDEAPYREEFAGLIRIVSTTQPQATSSDEDEDEDEDETWFDCK